MEIKQFVVFITLFLLFSCAPEPQRLKKIEGKQININDSIKEVAEIEEFIAPYRQQIQADLTKVLTFNPEYLSKLSDNLNTPLGNMMADAVYIQANPVFKTKTGNTIDFALLNYGGIRANIAAGNITTQTAFDIMPFENTIVVAELPYDALIELRDYLIKDKKPHPVSEQFHLEITGNNAIKSFTIHNKVPDKNKTYFVATSDYLLNGGDDMTFFKKAVSVTSVNYMVRKALIDYFSEQDTLKTLQDHRFYLQK